MKANNFDFVVEKHKAVLLKMFEWNEHPSYYNNLSHWEIFAMFVNDFLKKHSLEKTAENYVEQIDKEFLQLNVWLQETNFPNYFVKIDKKKFVSFKDYVESFIKDYLNEFKKLYKKMIDENLPELPEGKSFEVKPIYKSDKSDFNFAEAQKSMLEAIYLLENKNQDMTYVEFYNQIISTLRSKFAGTFARTNHSLQSITLSEEEALSYEKQRQDILYVLDSFLNINNDDYIHYTFLCNQIAACSVEEFKQLLDKLLPKRQELIEYYKSEIKKLESQIADIEKTSTTSLYENSKAVKLAKELELNKQYLAVFESNEWIIPTYFNTVFGDGDNFLTQKIHHSFTQTYHDPNNDFNTILLYLINMQELDRIGFIEKGFTIKKNGYLYKNGQPTTIDAKFEDLEIIKKIRDIDFSHQINVVCDIDYATEKKFFKTKIFEHVEEKQENNNRTHEVETIRYTREVFASNPLMSQIVCGPVYVKFTKENLTRGTIEISLFKYLTDSIEAGIQIVRAEELYSLWTPDKKLAASSDRFPASHNLYGGETVDSTKHFHIYSLEEALWRQRKKLGYMDPSHIVLSSSLTHEQLDKLFNNCCGINTYTYDITHKKQPTN